MKVFIKRVDKSLPLPKYETSGSVGFDFLCRKGAIIHPGEIKLIPANVVIEVPPGYMLMIVSRSSTPLKRGLVLRNGVGIIDQDYCGQSDEVHIQVYNFTKKAVKIEKGDRIAQGIFVKTGQAEWREVRAIGKKSRGGFGSTG